MYIYMYAYMCISGDIYVYIYVYVYIYLHSRIHTHILQTKSRQPHHLEPSSFALELPSSALKPLIITIRSTLWLRCQLNSCPTLNGPVPTN